MLELIKNLIRYRPVLTNFVLRDIKVKYRGTALGYFWSLLEPLSLVLVYWFVFSIIARRGGPDYPLVVMLGVIPYQFFNQVVSGGANALVGNASLIRRVYLPRELFVVGTAGSSLVVLVLSLFVCVPFMVAYQVVPGWRLIVLPFGLALIFFFSLGLALMLACANAIYRDVAYVVRVVLRLSFYVSPVIYSVEMVPESIRAVYLANPLAVYLSMVRSSIMNQPFGFGAQHAAAAAAVSVLTMALGARLFQRWQAEAVKFL